MERLVASVGYLGFVPRRLWGTDKGAGTFGAAVAWAISVMLWSQPWWIHGAVFGVSLALSLWSARPFADGDPGWVCIDETAGTFLAVIGLAGWPWLVAVAVARAADIFKVLPGVAPAERLPGALGLTMDDVVAGGYGLAAGWIVALVVG
jgi:phosphatidylglycerophosphatase A